MVKIDKIIRSKRKTVAIVVEPDGQLIVRAPKRAGKRLIQAMVNEREEWIKSKQAEARAEYLRTIPKKFKQGEEFFFMGKAYPLMLVDRRRPPLVLNGHFELSRNAHKRAEEVFVEWYRNQARQLITNRVEEIAYDHSFHYQRIRITSARTRWGSCNSRGGLNFTWRLVMTPLPIIDYVVLHELVHTEIQNHSSDFWNRMEVEMPECKQRRKWLKENGYIFQFP